MPLALFDVLPLALLDVLPLDVLPLALKMHYNESKRLIYDPTTNINIEKDQVRRGFNGYDYRVL